jgi:V-type H+-transporting ATPase subunit d
MVSCRMATDDTPMPTYGFLTYNVQDGFNEAVLRGFRSGILTQVDYNNLEQCEQIDGARKPVGQIFVSPF